MDPQSWAPTGATSLARAHTCVHSFTSHLLSVYYVPGRSGHKVHMAEIVLLLPNLKEKQENGIECVHACVHVRVGGCACVCVLTQGMKAGVVREEPEEKEILRLRPEG